MLGTQSIWQAGLVAVLGLCGWLWPVSADAKTFRTSSGQARTYESYRPAASANQPLPVLFVLHGGGGTAKSIHRRFSFDHLAKKQPALILYPQGVEGHWNDGRSGAAVALFKGPKPDDVAFLRELAGHFVKKGQADPARIYVVGVSNGGMMSQRLLCEASDVFAGGASLIANIPTTQFGCAAEFPRPFLMINGDADPLMPWLGGGVGLRHNRGNVSGSMASFSHWRRINQCGPELVWSDLPDRNRQDETRAKRAQAMACESGHKVEMIHIAGGGHTVPGLQKNRNSRRAKTRKKVLGPTNMDFDARDRVWNFLRGD